MPMKEWVRKLQPLQLYIVLILTIVFFITELVLSHITHAITLLMDSYHMLCNILALTGCIITIKQNSKAATTNENGDLQSSQNVSTISEELTSDCQDKKPEATKIAASRASQATKLKNTFGWARIDVVSMLMCCVFMASLSFSVIVEALQTLVHIDHQDAMHHPISVLCLGAAGLLLNGICYLLIGGYTFHQGSFLHVTESGDVVLDRVVVPDLVRQGGRRLSSTRREPAAPAGNHRQGFREMCRDSLGCILVIICALLVYLTDKNVAKYVDPVMSLISAILLMLLSYPYMKESCLILLQTMPGSINIDLLKKDLTTHFPDIVNVHDFHVWQLTATKIISTVHIIFHSHKGYGKLMDDIKEFLTNYGITQVTIQPEFFTKEQSVEDLTTCIFRCQGEGCLSQHCCPTYETKEKAKQISSSSSSKKLRNFANSLPDLRSIRVINTELSKTTEYLNTATGKSEENEKF